MSVPMSRPSQASSSDAVLVELFEEIATQLQAGEPVDLEVYVQEHPEQAEQLRRLLPTIHVLADLGRSAAQGDPSVASVAAPAEIERGLLGDFRIIQEIGRGGMGIVYEGEQVSLGRRVALKVLPFAAALDAKQLQRFKNEAQAAAHLPHTNIVPVHYVGCERGVHFYAMQYIDGQPLSQVIHELRGLADSAACVSRPEELSGRETQAAEESASSASNAATVPRLVGTTFASTSGPAFFRTVAQVGVQAAEALEHAHQLGVVHRDIKLANLLLDVRGNLWITDFGLAHCQSQGGLTLSGDLVGTLRYMSPEQAMGKRALVDDRSDVYSLGVTLYEVLTLEPAFSGGDREELLQQIALEEPSPPRQRNRAIPRELETIVLKAMEKNPEARYATAQELADDLRRFLEDRPIQAKRPTLLQRAAKWTRRHKVVVRAAAVVLVLAAVALVVSTLLIGRAQERTKQEQWMREKEERMREVVIPTVRRLVREKNYSAAFELAEKAELAIAADPTLAELRPQKPKCLFLLRSLQHAGRNNQMVVSDRDVFPHTPPACFLIQLLYGRMINVHQGNKIERIRVADFLQHHFDQPEPAEALEKGLIGGGKSADYLVAVDQCDLSTMLLQEACFLSFIGRLLTREVYRRVLGAKS
jgi:serine/threonine protein kinase